MTCYRWTLLTQSQELSSGKVEGQSVAPPPFIGTLLLAAHSSLSKSLGKDQRGVADGMAEGVEPRMVQKHYRHSSPVAT